MQRNPLQMDRTGTCRIFGFNGRSGMFRFKWIVPEHAGSSVEAEVALDGESVVTNTNARMRMTDKTKTTSAYMFNYNILKGLVDIDFERIEETGVVPGESDLPF